MSYLKSLLIPLTFIFFDSLVCESRLLQKKAVVQKAVVIEKQIARERCVVYGLTALSLAQNIYPWVALYKGQTTAGAVDQKQLSMADSIKESFRFLFYTQEGWSSIVQTVIGAGSGIVISNVCEKFVHPDTSRWYVHAHVPYVLTITMMQEWLAAMHNDSLEFKCVDDHKKHVHLLCDRLVQQGESICAYMVYKAKRLDEEEKALAKRAARSMFIAQNCWLQHISEQLFADNINYQELGKLLVAYEENISFQLNHFSVIEGETSQERYVVKRQIKQSLS